MYDRMHADAPLESDGLTGHVTVLAAASVGVVHGRRRALVVSIEAEEHVRELVLEAMQRAQHAPDNVQGLADYTAFPSSGLYIWTGSVRFIGRSSVTGVPWFTWDGAWRLSVPAEVATAAMSAIVETGATLTAPAAADEIRQLTRSLWGGGNLALMADEERRAAK